MSIIQDIRKHLQNTESAIMHIIYACIAGFVLGNLMDLIFDKSWHEYFYLSSKLGSFLLKPWAILSYIFIHFSLWHLISNMIWLWFIGEIFRGIAGNKRVWITFIGGGIAGGVLYLLAYNLLPDLLLQDNHLMIGASAGVTAVVVAAGVLLPNYAINLFGVFNIKLKWIALFRVLTDISVLGKTGNDGGTIAHLGGAIFGFIFVYYLYDRNFEIPSFFKRNKRAKKSFRKKKKFKVEINKPEGNRKSTRPNQHEIDAVLEKISESGYTSLSKSEKEILFKASK